jgi:hypothetical protein
MGKKNLVEKGIESSKGKENRRGKIEERPATCLPAWLLFFLFFFFFLFFSFFPLSRGFRAGKRCQSLTRAIRSHGGLFQAEKTASKGGGEAVEKRKKKKRKKKEKKKTRKKEKRKKNWKMVQLADELLS